MTIDKQTFYPNLILSNIMNRRPSELVRLAKYLAGEFDNQAQAREQAAHFVHLRLWHRPTPLFTQDSITLLAEQANTLKLDQPYRQRLLRILPDPDGSNSLVVQYYMFKDPTTVRGAGQNPDLLESLTPEAVEFLPSCTLKVQSQSLGSSNDEFFTTPATPKPCSFQYQGNTYQVFLSFKVSPGQLKVFDYGIAPQTGQRIWGALMGPYCFSKLQDYAVGEYSTV